MVDANEQCARDLISYASRPLMASSEKVTASLWAACFTCGDQRDKSIVTQNSGAPEVVTQQLKKPELRKRILNGVVDAFASFLVIMLVSWAFEHFASQEALNNAVNFQAHLYETVKAFSPTSIFRYLIDSHDFLFFHIDDLLMRFLPMLIVNNIMFALWFVLWIFVIGMSPVLLPITVLVEGNWFEWILVFFVFVPLAIFVASTSEDGTFFGDCCWRWLPRPSYFCSYN